MTAILPWLGNSPWVRFEWPRAWANEMNLQAELFDDRVEIMVDNVSTFRLMSEGPLGDLAGLRDLIVNGQRVALLIPGFGELRVAATADDDWTVTGADPIDWDIVGFVGQAGEILSRDAHPPEAWDSALGNFFCDAILAATDADVAFQNNRGIRTDMEQDAISLRDLFTMNFPNELYTFERTGAQLLAMLEHDLRDGNERPMQIAGFTYVFDRSQPEGQRIVESTIDPKRNYTIAAQAYAVERGDRFFGAEIDDWTHSGTQTVGAQIRYVQQLGTVMAPQRGRIREMGAVKVQ